MSINLIAVRNPQWKTVKTERLEDDGNIVSEADRTQIMDIGSQEEVKKVQVIKCKCQ